MKYRKKWPTFLPVLHGTKLLSVALQDHSLDQTLKLVLLVQIAKLPFRKLIQKKRLLSTFVKELGNTNPIGLLAYINNELAGFIVGLSNNSRKTSRIKVENTTDATNCPKVTRSLWS